MGNDNVKMNTSEGYTFELLPELNFGLFDEAEDLFYRELGKLNLEFGDMQTASKPNAHLGVDVAVLKAVAKFLLPRVIVSVTTPEGETITDKAKIIELIKTLPAKDGRALVRYCDELFTQTVAEINNAKKK